MDRDFIYRTTLPVLNRVLRQHLAHPAYPYVLALHSLNNITKTKSSRLLESLKTDPGLEHPTMYEIMPQRGLQITGLQPYEAQFLTRLRKHTWIAQRDGYMNAAVEGQRTPFFLAGVDTDVIKAASLGQLGVDPSRNGRLPDIFLLDLTSRARDRMGQAWQRPLRQLLDLCLELYLDDCPAVLAVTDDVFVCDILRNSIIREHEKWRSSDVKGSGPVVKTTLILAANSDPLDQDIGSRRGDACIRRRGVRNRRAEGGPEWPSAEKALDRCWLGGTRGCGRDGDDRHSECSSFAGATTGIS